MLPWSPHKWVSWLLRCWTSKLQLLKDDPETCGRLGSDLNASRVSGDAPLLKCCCSAGDGWALPPWKSRSDLRHQSGEEEGLLVDVDQEILISCFPHWGSSIRRSDGSDLDWHNSQHLRSPSRCSCSLIFSMWAQLSVAPSPADVSLVSPVVLLL